ASRRGPAHRRRDGWSRSRAPSPGDDAATEAQPPRAYVTDAGIPPELEQALLRIAVVEAADARPEEVADLGPARREHATGSRQPDAHVELPQRAPNAARDGELEARDRAAGPDDPRELADDRGGIVDVAKQVRDGERVEGSVGKRQLFGTSLDQLHRGGQPAARFGEHLGALVETDNGAALLREQLE